MKKILLLLILPLFIACGDDDSGKDNPQYIDKSIIQGKWYNIFNDDSTVMDFGKRECISYSYDRYILHLKNTYNYGEYNITADEIYFGYAETGREYKIEDDTLFIKNVNSYLKYIKVKSPD